MFCNQNKNPAQQCNELYVGELQLHFEAKNGHGSMVCICLRVIGMKNIPII